MKTMHLAIITTAVITVIITAALMITTNENLFKPRDVVTEKIQKLVDYSTILHIFLPNNTGNDVGITTNDFDWSHDGKFAAFSMSGGAPVSYLWATSSDGKEIKHLKIPIKFNYIENIHFSPDSSSIFFVGQYNDGNETYQDIFRYDLGDATYHFVTKDSHVRAFDFMPDGNIVFVESHYNSTRLQNDMPIFLVRHYNLLWLASPDGKKIMSLYNGTVLFQEIAVSPDGNKIVFISSEDPHNPSSNGTDIVNINGLGGPIKATSSYLSTFGMANRNFTILKQSVTDGYANPKWLTNNVLLYQTMIPKCVKDRAVGTQSCPAGLLDMTNLSDNSTTVLYGNKVEPYTAPLFGYAISHDKRSIIFGMNFDFSNGNIDGTGIYKMDFETPLSEASGVR
ncbi:MAG: hypothetical protein ACRDFB_01780 [Rhabdochlamydiaceae bacterium]